MSFLHPEGEAEYLKKQKAVSEYMEKMKSKTFSMRKKQVPWEDQIDEAEYIHGWQVDDR